jgi:hypothetical protein
MVLFLSGPIFIRSCFSIIVLQIISDFWSLIQARTENMSLWKVVNFTGLYTLFLTAIIPWKRLEIFDLNWYIWQWKACNLADICIQCSSLKLKSYFSRKINSPSRSPFVTRICSYIRTMSHSWLFHILIHSFFNKVWLSLGEIESW